jgi:histidinol-phosphate aminotransferase
MFDINNITRKNIKNLKPYSSARDEFKGTEGVFLDANENPFNTPYNRYPDPLQWKVKEKLASIKGVEPSQIFLGNGSDEAIDVLMRAFCEPGADNIVSIDPSYGMYEVCADINDIEFRKVRLKDGFVPDIAALKSNTDAKTKLIFLCSPNNPTSNSFDTGEMLSLAENFNGLLVVDEAYIDFSSQPSLLNALPQYPNLVVLQTFSKAWGMAGLRMGMAFADERIIKIFNKIKYPYNINAVTQKLVFEALNETEEKNLWVKTIISERKNLTDKLKTLKFVQKIYPSDANFILVQMKDARKIFDYLINGKIITRDRSKVTMCEDCIRVTIGKAEENAALLDALKKYESKLS